MTIIVLGIQVAIAKLIDVTLETTRVILISKERPKLAFIVAFIDMLIYYYLFRVIFTIEFSLLVCIFFCLGFALGTFLGVKISNKYLKGFLTLNIITKKNNQDLIKNLRDENFALSIIDAKGKSVDKEILLLEINKKNLNEVKNIVKNYNEETFLIANETKYTNNGYIKEKR